MEQTVTEGPLSQEQQVSQLHTQYDGTVNSSGAHLEQDPIERWYPRRLGDDHLRQDKVQMPLCRDNLRGKCNRGAFCKYLHSESDEHDRSRFCENERQKLGAVSTLGNSQLYRPNEESDSATRFSSRGYRNRSPCRRFQSGRCYRGVSCPYLHPEMTNFDKLIDSRVEQQQVDRAVRDPGFGGRSRDNFVRISQEHVEANKENNSRIMSYSGECRSKSPCQHFLRGKCDFGASCKRWHPVNSYVSSRQNLDTQHHQGIAATSSYPGSGDRSRDASLRTSQVHDETYMHNHLRTGDFSREPRSRSPCRNYLSGKCYRGASCVHLHPVTVYDRTRFNSRHAEQHQGVSGTSRSPHFVDGSTATTFRMSQNHEDCKNYANQPYRDTHAFYEQNRAWSTKDDMQLSGNRENKDVRSRSLSYERQRNRVAGDFGGTKPIREVCLQFTKGRCTRGELCRYLHGYHEYATSTSNWSEKPKTEAAGDPGKFGVANQYANTTMAQDCADVRNYKMSLGETKQTGSSLISSDGCFDKKAIGRYVDDGIEPNIRKGDAKTMDGLKCEVSGEKVESFCNSAEGNENISLWSRPFKRQRSRSRSPFASQDDYSRKFRRSDSRTELRGGRSYNVAQFQYPDRRSYRYEKPMYHVYSQQHTNIEATSVNPRSREHNDLKMVTPHRHEVVTQGLQRANGDHGSNIVIAGKKYEAYYARCALQPSHTNQNDEELATDSSTVNHPEGAVAISQDALESGSSRFCGKHLASPLNLHRTVLEKEANIEIPIVLGQEGKEKTIESMPSIKTYSRKKSRNRTPVSCEELMEEEVTASKQGVPISSLVETSLSIPNTVNVFGIPVDMEMSASKNNDLEIVCTCDLPIKKKVKKKRKNKSPISVPCEESVKEEVTDALKMSASNNNLENVLMDDHPVNQQVKMKRKKKSCKSASCEEPMKEEVTDASNLGVPISSLLEASLSNPNAVNVSGVPIEMELSASKNNDLEMVLTRDLPVKEKVKKKRKKKSPLSASCAETVKEEVIDTLKLGTPVCSLVEMGASSSNYLENVLMDDHPVKQQIKKKHKKKRSKSASCEEPMKEEVADASKQGMPISSSLETSLSNPNMLSVSGVPVNMMMSASKNNDLENVRMCANPVKQQALQSPLIGVVPNSRRKLLVLDVNGILVDIVATYDHRYKPDTKVATKAVFKRPFCDDFLQFCFERFDVGIWSSRTRQNLKKIVDFLMRDTKNRLLFCYDQSHCTATGYKTLENKEKPLVLKELRYLWWDDYGSPIPWDNGYYYNETNTVLLDDSPYKALLNPPYTAIFPRPYSFKNAGDISLGPGGDLRVYLERLAEAENVQKFIKENPLGQSPISNTSRSWNFYANIIGKFGSQEEYANFTPDS